ncbi:MAG: hypothetical protein KGN01_06675 [Patescibacteria group bacterium]|nr:hypothetical protein [Patescibacteria group bacterium]
MILYLSGKLAAPGNVLKSEENLWKISGCQSRCWSFWELWPESPGYSKATVQLFEHCIQHGIKVMLDSGAFSLQQQWIKHKIKDEKEFSLLSEKMFEAYCKFCDQWRKKVEFYVTFDYKPEAEITQYMTEKMWKKGLDPVPVFHGDENVEERLRWYLKKGVSYLGISGFRKGLIGQKRTSTRFDFTDSCFRVLWDTKTKRTKVKVHGFGCTELLLMLRYPWTSVDSSTWTTTGFNGAILLVHRNGTKFTRLYISNHGNPVHRGKRHFSQLSTLAKDAIRPILEETGFSVEELSDDTSKGHVARKIFNARVFADFEKSLSKKPVVFTPFLNTLFGGEDS